MGIILELKNAIKDSIAAKDSGINFYFNNIKVAKYPFVFFYIPQFAIDNTAIGETNWSRLTLNCVLEYMKEEESSHIDLWDYLETITQSIKNFAFVDTKLTARDVNAQLVDDDRLQVTFILDIYVKYIDTNELMLELEYDLK